jgi:hypothetical protein
MKHPTFTLLLFCFFIYLSANSYAQRDSLAQKRKADSLSVVFELNKEAEFQAKAPMREAFLRKLANYPSDTVFELNIYNMAFREFLDFSSLDSLREVDFQENKLAKFPFQLLELPKIKLIFLSNNPFDLDKSEQLKLARLSKIYAQGGGRLVLFKKDD